MTDAAFCFARFAGVWVHRRRVGSVRVLLRRLRGDEVFATREGPEAGAGAVGDERAAVRDGDRERATQGGRRLARTRSTASRCKRGTRGRDVGRFHGEPYVVFPCPRIRKLLRDERKGDGHERGAKSAGNGGRGVSMSRPLDPRRDPLLRPSDGEGTPSNERTRTLGARHGRSKGIGRHLCRGRRRSTAAASVAFNRQIHASEPQTNETKAGWSSPSTDVR